LQWLQPGPVKLLAQGAQAAVLLAQAGDERPPLPLLADVR
jgi:hypothetical protein